jgi:RNA polymerase sigma factor (sigma-70 family)
MSHPQHKTNIQDVQSFEALHRTYYGRLLSSVSGMVRDRDRAEDITAKAFNIGWHKREQFRGEASAYTWLQAIARNEIRQSYAQREALPLDALGETVGEPDNLLTDLERRDAAARLRRALKQIPAIYRRALTAHFLKGQSTQRVATREGIPLGTVLSRIAAGKKLLRERLEATP